MSWSDTLLMGLFAFALRATVILTAAWLVTRALRRGSAASRHLVWTGAIAAVLALPVLQVTLPAWTVPVWSVSARTDAPVDVANTEHAAVPVVSSRPAAADLVPASRETPADNAPAVRALDASTVARVATSIRNAVSLRSLLAVFWLTLAALLVSRLAIANARVARWQRSSQPVEDGNWLALLRRLTRDHGIERPVVLLESEETDVPVTWGIVYPVVLLPAAAQDWDDEQRIAVLTHELAHVKRFDALTQQLAQLALALLWFHPLVWLAVRRMRLEREHACDDFVLVAGARATRYADDLLGLARRIGRPAVPAAAALAMARRSELEGRLLAILDPAAKRSAVRRARVALSTLAMLTLAAPLAAFRPGVRVETEPAPSTAVAPAPAAQPAVTPQAPAAGATVVQSAPPSPALERWSDDRTLATLSRRIGALPALSLKSAVAKLPGVRADTEPPRPVALETLIEVTKAAKRMTSDHEKGELLALIAKRYQRSDALRDAYLEAVFTMTSDSERSQALLALLARDSLPLSSVAQVLRSAAMMTSDLNRGLVLKAISPATFGDSTVQRAYLDVLVAMTSDLERAGAISNLLKQRPLTQGVQLALLQATTALTSSAEKTKVLLLFLDQQGIADEKVRKAFFDAAATMTSDSDYRKIMQAVMK